MHLQKALAAAQSVDAGAVLAAAKLVAPQAKEGGNWAAATIRAARENALANAMKK